MNGRPAGRIRGFVGDFGGDSTRNRRQIEPPAPGGPSATGDDPPIRTARGSPGDPFITHRLAVATILAELGSDDETLCAMLHDTIEDTECTIADLTHEFGAGIASLVDGAITLDRVRGRRDEQLRRARQVFDVFLPAATAG